MVTLVGRYNAASCRQSVITCLFNLRNPSSTGSLPLERPGHPELRTKMSFLLAPFSSPPPPLFSSTLSSILRSPVFVEEEEEEEDDPRAGATVNPLLLCPPLLLCSPLGGQVMDDLGPRRVLMEQRFHASRALVKHGLAAFFTHRPVATTARPRTVAEA